MKVSQNSNFVIFLDGNSAVIKLNASTGAYLCSTSVGDSLITQLFSSAISPDSLSITVGGRDTNIFPAQGFLVSMSSISLS